VKQTFLERAQEINSLALGSNFYPVFDNDKEKIPTTKKLKSAIKNPVSGLFGIKLVKNSVGVNTSQSFF